MARKVITIEINSTDIRLMEIRGERIVRWASLALEPTMVEGGVVSDPLALSTAVKQLMTSSGITGKDVIASVSGLYSVSRILVVSNLPRGLTTQEAVVAAAREVMPLAAEKLYLSWQTIATGEGAQQVIVVGVPREVIDSEMRALRAAGMNPRILDFKAMALARAVNKEQALIFNIGPTSFDIVMVVNGIPEITRTIAWQQDDLTVEDKAEYLAVNLELTVGFYNSHHPDTPLDPATPLVITGHMSRDLTLMERLQARVGYPIEPLAPPLECPVHLPVSQYAVNIGLALKGIVPSQNVEQGGYSPPDINLLPQTYQPWKPSARQIYLSCAILAAIALLFPLYQVTSEAMDRTANLEARYTILNSELERRQAELKDREPLQKAIAQYHTIVDMGDGFTETLKVISSQAEELGVEVQSITHEGSSITINCRADSYTTFRGYLTALEESGWFASVTRPPEQYSYVTGGTIKLEPKPSE